MGPVLLTADDAGDARDFHLTTRVNNELRQDARVGVGIGYDLPIFLKAGDMVSITIHPIGTLKIPVK